ncbi:hypothetical protein [Aquimarina agarilytica]|uniref:hypothetical protein n=1 Tax=Aquimarina agarilytica TaxID=1087449 RepID=UPI0002882C80|nr:hypothetical protein [Aquimarina agarilytica]
MQDDISKEVQEVLTETPEDISFEVIQGEDSSPLNQPVIEKDIGGEKQLQENSNWNVWKPEEGGSSQTKHPKDFRETTEETIAQEKAAAPLDAPEQTFEANSSEEVTIQEEADVELLSNAQATQAADALLGMTNNLLEVGGGYFVKINKHEAFFEFEEIIQLIDEQNTTNVERIKLDKEDQALLRPLLAQVLKKKAKKLTPEQQLIGAIISILVKKAQVVMEVRAENSLLEGRILQIIKEEKGETVVSTSEKQKKESLDEEEEKGEIEETSSIVESKENPIADAAEIH